MYRRVSCVPSSDDVFCRAADAALRQVDGSAAPDGIARVLADLLRSAYPSVEVHRQTDLARAFEEDVWYAYRDGRPVRGTSEDPD